MEPTIKEIENSLEKLSLEKDLPLRLHPRESYPEIKSPLAMAMKDAALLVVQKRNDVKEWRNFYSEGTVFEHRSGGVSQVIGDLQIKVLQRSDSSMSIQLFDIYQEQHSDPSRDYKLQLLETNSRGEVVSFLPSHVIYERMGLSKEEFAHMVITRLEGMANTIDRDQQVTTEQGNTLSFASPPLVNEEAVTKELLPEVSTPLAASGEAIESVPANSINIASTSTWMESLKAQIDHVDGSKLQVFSGNSKVYEQIDNVVTTDKLATPLGSKVQQALENPNELRGSVRIVVDKEKVYYAKDGQVLENKHSLTLENSQVAQSKSKNVSPEVNYVSEEQKQNLPITQEKSLEASPFEVKTKDNSSLNEPQPHRPPCQIFSVPLNSDQPKLDERIPKAASPVEVKTKDNSNLNEPQPHRPPCQIFSIPINPTPIELDTLMPEVVNSNKEANRGSLEQALASANARIDSLQAQLKDTQKSLEDLSKFVRNDNLKSWAEHKVTEVAKTSQSIAEQAKNKVMQWVQAKTVQVKLAIHDKVNEARTTAQNKVNEVKTAAQDKVNGVKEAAVLKGIEFKESVREQANKFLAPVNSAQVEQAAKHVVREYGDGKNYNKAATHSFHLNDKNELSVARKADGAVIYQKGELTASATSNDILKLNALPTVVNQIKTKQMQTNQQRGMEVGG